MSENLRTSLLALIALGKERGFLTRGELSDQLRIATKHLATLQSELAAFRASASANWNPWHCESCANLS